MITIERPQWRWDPWSQLERLNREMNGTFTLPRRQPSVAYPPLNIHTGEEDVVITTEIPGIDVSDIDLSVTGDVLSIKGTRKAYDAKEGETWHRRERGSGSFYRTVQLPYNVESTRVQADYTNGVLRIVLPRAEADKPRKITVSPGK